MNYVDRILRIFDPTSLTGLLNTSAYSVIIGTWAIPSLPLPIVVYGCPHCSKYRPDSSAFAAGLLIYKQVLYYTYGIIVIYNWI